MQYPILCSICRWVTSGIYGSNTRAPLRTRYQVSKIIFGIHSSNKSSSMVVAQNGLHFHLSWTHWTFFCRDTSSRECMQSLHQHCRNFGTVLRMLVPACHLPCCIVCIEKFSTVPRCVLLLKIDEPHFRQVLFRSMRRNKCEFCAFHLCHLYAQDVFL